MRKLILIMVLLLVACGQEARSDTDEGLYSPVAPEGSAFVRFVNTREDYIDISVNNKKYEAVGAHSASPYYVVPEGEAEFSFDGDEIKKNIQAGDYYTIFKIDKMFFIKDIANENRAKATLAFYNFQDTGVANLKAKGGAVVVLDYVLPNEMKTRDINPVKIDLSIVRQGDEAIIIEPFIMERGNHYSIFYNGEKAFVVTATTDTRS